MTTGKDIINDRLAGWKNHLARFHGSITLAEYEAILRSVADMAYAAGRLDGLEEPKAERR